MKWIGLSSNDALAYFTSAFLVLIVQQNEAGASRFIPHTLPVSMLLVRGHRKIEGGPFHEQNKEVFLMTDFPGGRRKSWYETPVDCALRQFSEEVGFLLDLAGVALSDVRTLCETAWNQDRLLAHIGRHASQVTIFLHIPARMMEQISQAIPATYASGKSEIISAVLMQEDAIIQQLVKYQQKISQVDNADEPGNEPILFVHGDMHEFVIKVFQCCSICKANVPKLADE